MADPKTRRLSPKVIQDDLDALAALEAMADYDPANPAFAKDEVVAAKTAMQGKQTLEVQKKAEYDALRDTAVAAEWAFHDKILGVKRQVAAQYGESSDQVQALGLKKKSEYKKTGKKPAPVS